MKGLREKMLHQKFKKRLSNIHGTRNNFLSFVQNEKFRLTVCFFLIVVFGVMFGEISVVEKKFV